MRLLKRLDPHSIIVKSNYGRYQGRIQTKLYFSQEYAEALRAALNCIRTGHTNVQVIQYRVVIHNHSELSHALLNLTKYSTDEEVIEEVHHSSRTRQLTEQTRFRKLPVNNVLTWATI